MDDLVLYMSSWFFLSYCEKKIMPEIYDTLFNIIIND